MAIKIVYENIRTDIELGDILILTTKTTENSIVEKVSNKYKVSKIETHRIKDTSGTSGYTSIQIEAI